MRHNTPQPHDLNSPVRAVCPRCGAENTFVPAKTPYLYCRCCRYVYAWLNKEGQLVIEGKSLPPSESSDK